MDTKLCSCSVLKAAGDYPACKYTGEWDALCSTQQRAFHGQSADPLTGVQLRQCNPKLFNQITRAWEKFCLWIMHRGVYVVRYESQCVIIFLQRCCWAFQAPQMLLAYRWRTRKYIKSCFADRFIALLSKSSKVYWKRNDEKYNLLRGIPVSQIQI